MRQRHGESYVDILLTHRGKSPQNSALVQERKPRSRAIRREGSARSEAIVSLETKTERSAAIQQQFNSKSQNVRGLFRL
jgi:hypothetical protein